MKYAGLIALHVIFFAGGYVYGRNSGMRKVFSDMMSGKITCQTF